MPDRFRCEGCGLITEDRAEVDDHKQRHGLVINIGPGHEDETETEYQIEIQAADGEWHWAGRAVSSPREAAGELADVVKVIQEGGLAVYYCMARIKKIVTVTTYGPEVRI